jgi:UDP-N-acetylglucosamine 2-epimerase (non-hydrolysing)
VAAALKARGLLPLLIFTGQHPALQPPDYGLGQYPAIRLRCPGRDDPHAHVGEVTKAVAPVLNEVLLLVVQGDTSSALGAALAASMAGVPLAHVEAGLRSHDRRHPWPEEEFRVAIDRHSDLLFAPTELNAANLRRERLGGRIHVTGNTGVDALLALRRARGIETQTKQPCLLVTCHRRENWALGIESVADAVKQIASERLARVAFVLHPNPALRLRLQQQLLGSPGVAFRQPCSHSETIDTMLRSDLVLSDSGGMQEEAAALGVPLLVLREKTERPEAIVSGIIELVGTDPERIVSVVRRRLSGAAKAPRSLPFGDGRASERIARLIAEWMEEREALSSRMTVVAHSA